MISKRHLPRDYQKQTMTRREFIRRGATVLTIGAATSYVTFAPEDWPLSLKDTTGLRSQPKSAPFKLPEFSVAATPGRTAIGVGRAGDLGVKLRKALDAVGGITHYIQPGDVVLIKPNVAFDRAPNLGATTNPEIIEALIRLLLVDCRAKEVRVADNPIESPADCFAKSGIRRATERAGGRIYLPDSNSFKMLATPGATLIAQWPFFHRPFKNVNKVIGIAPIKDHNLCHASMGIKNWYGLLGGRRNQFHQDIHEIISDLAIMLKPTLTILDGTHVLMENGPTGGDPAYVKNADVIVAGVDPVAMDAWAYEHLLERTEPLPQYLYKAEEKGSGKIDYRGRIREIS